MVHYFGSCVYLNLSIIPLEVCLMHEMPGPPCETFYAILGCTSLFSTMFHLDCSLAFHNTCVYVFRPGVIDTVNAPVATGVRRLSQLPLLDDLCRLPYNTRECKYAVMLTQILAFCISMFCHWYSVGAL